MWIPMWILWITPAYYCANRRTAGLCMNKCTLRSTPCCTRQQWERSAKRTDTDSFHFCWVVPSSVELQSVLVGFLPTCRTMTYKWAGHSNQTPPSKMIEYNNQMRDSWLPRHESKTLNHIDIAAQPNQLYLTKFLHETLNSYFIFCFFPFYNNALTRW